MAGKMAAICISAVLNLHTDKSHALLTIMFSVITQPRYIESSIPFMFITTSQCSLTFISPCPIPGSYVADRLPGDRGASANTARLQNTHQCIQSVYCPGLIKL